MSSDRARIPPEVLDVRVDVVVPGPVLRRAAGRAGEPFRLQLRLKAVQVGLVADREPGERAAWERTVRSLGKCQRHRRRMGGEVEPSSSIWRLSRWTRSRRSFIHVSSRSVTHREDVVRVGVPHGGVSRATPESQQSGSPLPGRRSRAHDRMAADGGECGSLSTSTESPKKSSGIARTRDCTVNVTDGDGRAPAVTGDGNSTESAKRRRHDDERAAYRPIDRSTDRYVLVAVSEDGPSPRALIDEPEAIVVWPAGKAPPVDRILIEPLVAGASTLRGGSTTCHRRPTSPRPAAGPAGLSGRGSAPGPEPGSLPRTDVDGPQNRRDPAAAHGVRRRALARPRASARRCHRRHRPRTADRRGRRSGRLLGVVPRDALLPMLDATGATHRVRSLRWPSAMSCGTVAELTELRWIAARQVILRCVRRIPATRTEDSSRTWSQAYGSTGGFRRRGL